MIILIKHKKPIIGKGKGFSIVDGKISYMKGVGQSLSRLSTMVQHSKNPIPLKINRILYQVGDNVSIEDLKKNQQHNKETVFYKEKDIIRNLWFI